MNLNYLTSPLATGAGSAARGMAGASCGVVGSWRLARTRGDEEATRRTGDWCCGELATGVVVLAVGGGPVASGSEGRRGSAGRLTE